MACPSGQELLAFHLASLTSERRETVSRHLDQCDFCGAELQLLENFPQGDLSGCDKPGDLPAPLRRLAEALFHGDGATIRALFDSSPDSKTVASTER
ncbi:MAG: hypothetical protein ABIP75_19885 [Pyrinomonadaceae bacterium]